MFSKKDTGFPDVPSFLLSGTPTVHQPFDPSPKRGQGLTVGLSTRELEFGPAERNTTQSDPVLESILPNTDTNPPGPPKTPHPENRSLPPKPPDTNERAKKDLDTMEVMRQMMKVMEE